MKREAAFENLTGAIIAICRSGLPPDALRARVFSRLRRAVPFDAAFWATVDPATLLFTGPHQEEIPPRSSSPPTPPLTRPRAPDPLLSPMPPGWS